MGRGVSWIRTSCVALVVLVADQVTKSAINSRLIQGRLIWPIHGGGLFGIASPRAVIPRSQRLHVLPGIELVNVHNPDMILGGYVPGPPLAVMIVLSAFGAVSLWRFSASNKTIPMIWLWIGSIIGGGLGNLLSLVREGSVTDFLRLSWLGPTFNLADAALILGLLMLTTCYQLAKRRSSREISAVAEAV